MDIDIRYEDKDIIVCNKPSGMPSETADIAKDDMISLVRRYLREKDCSDLDLGLVHRLDQPVSGLMVFAKDKKALKALNYSLTKGEIKKKYRAKAEGIIEGRLLEDTELVNYLLKDKKNNLALVYDKEMEKSKRSVLIYRILKQDRALNTSLLDIDLITGRFHQIRAQLSHMGHPLLGDVKYGYRGDTKGKGIALSAYSLSLKLPSSGKAVTVSLSDDEILN
ncbi:MAG: RluA family pseudouridine synthase [Lachnospiraceae bacterium]|nr:RluA family pseudouridine synthase [Lachnospiraceae bacterium]